MDWWADIGAQGDLGRALQLAASAPPVRAAWSACRSWRASARRCGMRRRAVPCSASRSNTARAHLARAVLEGTAYELRLMTDAVLAAGARIDDLRLCGGQARSRVWNQVKADVTGLACSVPRVPDAALMGSAICAALGRACTRTSNPRPPRWSRPAYTLEPDPGNRRTYDTLFSRVSRRLFGAAAVLRAARGGFASQLNSIRSSHLTH